MADDKMTEEENLIEKVYTAPKFGNPVFGKDIEKEESIEDEIDEACEDGYTLLKQKPKNYDHLELGVGASQGLPIEIIEIERSERKSNPKIIFERKVTLGDVVSDVGELAKTGFLLGLFTYSASKLIEYGAIQYHNQINSFVHSVLPFLK
jgi:hypothetical protein